MPLIFKLRGNLRTVNGAVRRPTFSRLQLPSASPLTVPFNDSSWRGTPPISWRPARRPNDSSCAGSDKSSTRRRDPSLAGHHQKITGRADAAKRLAARRADGAAARRLKAKALAGRVAVRRPHARWRASDGRAFGAGAAQAGRASGRLVASDRPGLSGPRSGSAIGAQRAVRSTLLTLPVDIRNPAPLAPAAILSLPQEPAPGHCASPSSWSECSARLNQAWAISSNMNFVCGSDASWAKCKSRLVVAIQSQDYGRRHSRRDFGIFRESDGSAARAPNPG